jgi:hypothetical protein
MVKAYESPSLVTISANSLNSTSANVSSGGGHTVGGNTNGGGTGSGTGGSTGNGGSGGGTGGGSSTATNFINVLSTEFIFPSGIPSLISILWTRILQVYGSTHSNLYCSWFFFRFIGSLYYDNTTLNNVAWSLIAGGIFDPYSIYTSSSALGLDSASYHALNNGINLNHYNDGNGKGDFAHQCITTATHLSSILGNYGTITDPIFSGLFSPAFTSSQIREALAGWLGDAVFRDEGIFEPGDFTADLDAINIASLILLGHNPASAFSFYYNSPSPGTDINCAENRVQRFLETIDRSVPEISDAIWSLLITLNFVNSSLMNYNSAMQRFYYQANYSDINENFLDQLED